MGKYETADKNDTVILMEKYHSDADKDEEHLQKKNTVDKYLQDIYDRHTLFHLTEARINDIERRVVNVVSEIVENVMKESSSDVNKLLIYIGNVFHSLTKAERLTGMILKVGSFYEETKNGYPDEFDFILVIGRFNCSENIDSNIYFNDTVIHDRIRNFLTDYHERGEFFTGQRPKYKDQARTSRSLKESPKTHVVYIGQRGPSTKFRIDLNGVEINVDLVPAVLVSGVNDITYINKNLQCPDQFRKEINRTGSFLLVNGRLSFTQTEVHFMKHVLSPKHRKVYKICKYLIDGNNNYSELIRQKYRGLSLWEFQKASVSTYMIKTEIIFHHYECTNTDTPEGECVLGILRKLLNIESGKPIRSLTDASRTPLFYKDKERCEHLTNMINDLEHMQKSFKDYSYHECHVTPLNRHIYALSKLDDLGRPSPSLSYPYCSNKLYVCCIDDKITTIIIGVLIAVFFIILYFVL